MGKIINQNMEEFWWRIVVPELSLQSRKLMKEKKRKKERKKKGKKKGKECKQFYKLSNKVRAEVSLKYFSIWTY